MLDSETLNAVHNFQEQNSCKNESAAIVLLVNSFKSLQHVITALEKKAHEAQEWKLRAENKVGTDSKHISVPDASKDTGSKHKSVENTKDIQQQNEAA